MTQTQPEQTKTSWFPMVSLFLAQVLMSFNRRRAADLARRHGERVRRPAHGREHDDRHVRARPWPRS